MCAPACARVCVFVSFYVFVCVYEFVFVCACVYREKDEKECVE